ncbi:MAG: carboxypeptidase-like regulatory domain-containing protein [Candidatus Acidiferrales bacterium]
MKVSRILIAWAIIVLGSSLFSPAAKAQYRAGLQGVVLDAQGAAVEGATVTLTNSETNHSQETTSGSGGVYTFSSLPPGNYTVAVEKKGFKKNVLENVSIAGEQIQALNVTLELGEVTSSVTVNASSESAIDTETGQVSGTLSSTEVQDLPSFGRDPFQLLRLAPGVFGDGAHNNGGGTQAIPGSAGPGGTSATSSIFQIENQVQAFADGQRNEANSFQIDGVSVNSLDWGGAAIITPNEESVKEVRITSNSYDADLGHGSGAQVEVVSQNGTNSYHGSAFIKIDRPGLNAFQAYNGPSSPGANERVNDRFNQFGGSVGGPIIRNHLFVFFSYETLRNNSVETSNQWVETSQYLAAVQALGTPFLSSAILGFPGEGASFSKVLPSTCSQAGFTTAANCQPAGTGLDIGSLSTSPRGTPDPTFGTAATPNGIGSGLDGIPDIQFVQATNPTKITESQYNGRLDFQATSSDLLTFSIYWVPTETTTYNGNIRPANLFHHAPLNYSEALVWNHTFGPTLINEARFNVSRWYFDELASNPQEPWGLPEGTITGLPGALTGINNIVYGANPPGIFFKTGYNIRDTVTKVLNRQSLKFGVDIYKEQNTQVQSSGARPTYNFNDLWDFANDAPVLESGNFNPVTGIPTTLTSYVRDNDIALFVQDDYKLKPNLTVNLGLRWEYFGPFHEKYGNLGTAVLGPPPNQLADISVKLGGNLYNADYHNFGPQIGFAWSPNSLPYLHHDFQNRLVVRGGFGIGYNRTEDAIPLNALTNPSPIFASFGILAGSNIVYAAPSDPHQFAPYPGNPNAMLTFDPTTNIPATGAPITLSALPRNLLSPYTYRYSLLTQYDLGHSMIATVGYQGSSSHRLLRWNFNGQILFEPQNPQVNNLRYWTDDVDGNYNALLTELQKRFSHGFQVDAQYTFSRAMDDASTNFYFEAYPFNSKAGYGPSDYDATHNFKLWGLWSPQFFHDRQSWEAKVIDGWTFSGIWNVHSGFPWSPLYNVQVVGDPNTCSLIFENSGYCSVRPAAYLGGAGTNYSNSTFKKQLGNFPNGPTAYFTPPILSTTAIPPVPGVARNSFRGPRYSSVDFTLAKAFGLPSARVIGEHAQLEIRANFYNLFNQVNLGPLGNQTIGNIALTTTGQTVSGNGTFDQAQFALAGRVIEAQARFSF